MAWQYLLNTGGHGRPQNDVLIATPNIGMVSYDWAVKFRQLNMIPGLSWATAGYQGQPVDIARNILVTNALKLQAKYIFFLDSDVIVYPDTLVNLYKRQLPVVSATYINRSHPYNIVANINKQSIPGSVLQQTVPSEPITVDETGAGALLIDTRVLYRLMDTKIVNDWFCLIDHEPTRPGPKEIATYNSAEAKANDFICRKCLEKRKETNIIIGNFFTYNIQRDKDSFEGEDYNFCKKVRRLGIQIRLDMTNAVQHEVYRLLVDAKGMHNTTSPAGDTTKGDVHN
jgi:hypothetical protein